MMNGMMSIKKLNNFIQNLYKILYYTFMKKTIQNSSHKSKNRRSDCCIKDINIRSSFFVYFPKSFKSMMEYQVIFQYRRITHEKKITYIHYCHNFFQSDIISATNFIKVFINQTRFDKAFIGILIF